MATTRGMGEMTDSRNAESAAPKQQIGRPFKPGQSGNLAGRPKGSRNKLSEEFIAEVYADWCEHGAGAIQTVRETRPEV